MAVKTTNYIGSKSEYTCTYRDMKGVDFSSDGSGIPTGRFSYLENMYRDYDGAGAAVTESVPGFRKILETGEKINGIYTRFGKDGKVYVVVHAGTSLYTFPLDSLDSISNTTPICTLLDTKSHARAFGDTLYIFDSAGIIALTDDGAYRVGDGSSIAPYIPTTFIDGVQHEQRNLLTKRFFERSFIGSCSDFGHGTRGFTYEILSEEGGSAILTSGAGSSGVIYVPSTVRLNGRLYTVREIGRAAFKNNTAITAVHICEGVRVIGKQAFFGCTSLTRVLTPDSIEEICTSAFSGCVSLAKFHLGGGMKKYGKDVFESCDTLEEIEYAMNLASYAEIENYSESTKYTILFDIENLARAIEIPLYTPTVELLSVKLDGQDIEYSSISEEGLIRAVVIEAENKYTLEGHEIELCGVTSDDEPQGSVTSPDFLTAIGGISAEEAIIGCTVSESFDGRIFLSGNPKLPNTVFYSARDSSGNNNPLYFGSLNYFNDGVGGYCVRSLLATANMLAVFKSGDDGSGSIFYHTPKETELDIMPKIYPVAYVHSGIYATGGSISFFDDPLFISPLGVCALEKQSINLDRSIVCRSHNVNAKLLCEAPEKIRLAEWCGYLVVLSGGRIYLADSRSTFTHKTGSVEYEWYYLSGVGTYKGDSRAYRYSSTAHPGYAVHPNASGIAEGTLYSTTVGGDKVYYVSPDGKTRYEVVASEERIGGVFSPASELTSIYGYLIFGCKNGDVCVFNNDKRGIPPVRVSTAADFDAEDYGRKMGRKIHPDFYSFAGHAPRYALITPTDNCGMPHLTKSTVRNSLAVKCRALSSGRLTCEVGTDRSGYSEITGFPGGEFDFESLDFTQLSTNTQEAFTVVIGERERGWIEKQLAFYTEDFASPFGIYSISYRFTVKGQIKKQ